MEYKRIEDIDGELLADLRNKLSPVLNLCQMIKDGDNPVFNSPMVNQILNSEIEKTIKVIKFITKTEKEEDETDFHIVIEKVENQMSEDDRELFLEFTDYQEKHDAIWYKTELGIPEPVKWEKGSYVLNGKTKMYYIIDDNGNFVGTSLDGHFMFIGINQI